MDKVNVKVKVYEDDEVEWNIPSNPEEFMKFWEDKLSLIPEEYKDNAFINIEAIDSWGCASMLLEIGYTRPETGEECKRRLEKIEAEEDRRRRVDLKRLAELQDKYKDDLARLAVK